MRRLTIRLSNLFITLFLILNVFVSPFAVLAQDVTSSVSEVLEIEQTAESEQEQELPLLDTSQLGEIPTETDGMEDLGELEVASEEADEEESAESGEIFASAISPSQRRIDSLTLTYGGNVLNNGGTLGYYDGMEVKYDISIPDHVNVAPGDTLTLTMPAQLVLRTGGTFPVYAPGGVNKAGDAVLNPGNGTVTVTFNNYFQTQNEDKRMTISAFAGWNHNNTSSGVPISLNFDGIVRSLIKGPIGTGPVHETLTKWGRPARDNRNEIQWTVRVNGKRDYVQNITVTDVFDTSTQEYVAGSLTADYVGDAISYEYKGAVPKSKFTINGDGFTYRDDKLDRVMVYIYYRTRVKDNGASLFYKNQATYDGDGRRINNVNAVYLYEGGAGNASATGADKIVLKANKVLTGRRLQDGEFSFQLVRNSNGAVIQTKTNNASGEITFDAFSIREEGNHQYTIREVNSGAQDINYDTTPVNVNIQVTDIFGRKYAKITYSKNGVNSNTFSNSLAPLIPVSHRIEVTKKLTGRNLQANEFEFLLTELGGSGTTQRVRNTADGKVSFAPITYTSAGTYRYKITEVAGQNSNIEYSKEEIYVTVKVEERSRTLVATVEYPQDKEFNNTYTPRPTQLAFRATKKLTGWNLENGQFDFELVKKGATNVVVAEASNDEHGNIVFPAQTFTEVGNHTYIIREVDLGMAGYTYDNMQIEVNVAIVDNGGQLEARATYPQDTEFNNNYKAQPTEVVLRATKQLKGRNLANEQFEFELVDKNRPESVISTAKNNQAGEIVFPALRFTESTRKTYVIREKNTNAPGYTYDSMAIEVTVNVTDNGRGQLVAEAVYPRDTEFNNSYSTQPTNIVLQATKKLTGRTLADRQFEFELVKKDAPDDVLHRAR
ncbi:Ig-like domain-containing protein, partial [Aerococcaceae bacterium NML160702]|nr:Ig-like domain-containing protein [Aerococcaceae bacterium NML160702]